MTPPSPVAIFPGRTRPSPKVAVLLNANARAVNRRVVRQLSEAVPARDLFLSRTLDEAKQIAAEVVSRGYDTVLTGGGDGTFMGFANALIAEQGSGGYSVGRDGTVRRLDPQPLPRMGVLRLGTGNALASMTGASPLRGAGVLEDVLQARAGRVDRTRRLDLIEVEGVHAPFTGLGWDALILNNYIRWKKMTAGTPLRMFGEGGWGYGLSVSLLSVPQAIRRGAGDVEIINRGAPASPVDSAGRTIGPPVPTGGILYRGPAKIASTSTCPFYGLGLKLFPAADRRPGRMQLRVGFASVYEALSRLPLIWRGRYDSPQILDWMVDDVEMRFERPQPFQIGGDAAGWRESVRMRVSDRPVELLDFARPALVAHPARRALVAAS